MGLAASKLPKGQQDPGHGSQNELGMLRFCVTNLCYGAKAIGYKPGEKSIEKNQNDICGINR